MSISLPSTSVAEQENASRAATPVHGAVETSRPAAAAAWGRPPQWSLERLRAEVRGRVVVWATASVRSRVSAVCPWPVVAPEASVPVGTDWLIVVGGGELMDRAKTLRLDWPGLKLALLPSIWGSGAEASPVIVRARPGGKMGRMEPASLPDAIVYWPELARTVPAARQRAACGDCWAHALEGFLSPLATPELREELAELIRRMLPLPLAYDPQWFELSATACAGQARAGVGLIHGIAHTLEGPLQSAELDLSTPPGPGTAKVWHHARLCSIFLAPVMRLNREHSDKWPCLLADHGLPETEIGQVLEHLFEPDGYRAALPALRAHWRDVLRDPCTRTNSALVRPGWLEEFERMAPA